MKSRMKNSNHSLSPSHSNTQTIQLYWTLQIARQPIFDFKRYVSNFSNAFSPQDSRAEIQDFPSFEDLIQTSNSSKIPHALFIFANSEDYSLARPYLQKLRSLDPFLNIFLISHQDVSKEHLMAWFDSGVSALLNPKFSMESIRETLGEIVLSRLGTHHPRPARVPAKHKIQIRCASLEQALVAETLNLGIGGMFVRSLPQGVAPGDLIEFSFQMSSEVSEGFGGVSNPNPLVEKINEGDSKNSNGIRGAYVGTGTVAWIRTQAQPSAPEGMGVKFLELSSDTQKLIEGFIKRHGVHSYIPRA